MDDIGSRFEVSSVPCPSIHLCAYYHMFYSIIRHDALILLSLIFSLADAPLIHDPKKDPQTTKFGVDCIGARATFFLLKTCYKII